MAKIRFWRTFFALPTRARGRFSADFGKKRTFFARNAKKIWKIKYLVLNLHPETRKKRTGPIPRNENQTKMKKLYKKDIKGIKINDEINRVIEMVNNNRINTYDMQGGLHFNAIMEISFYLLKNRKFEESKYYDAHPFDFLRISWYLSDIFNATISDTQRMMRTMSLVKGSQIYMSERFGLNYFEVIR